MNKVHEYRGFTFFIGVELNHTVRHPGGLCQHKIIINDMGVTNYYKTRLCETIDLVDTINSLIKDAEIWVDTRLDESKLYEVKLLETMGFKK